MTRKLAMVGMALVGAACCMGCLGRSSSWAYPHGKVETVADTPDDHQERVARALDRDQRALGDDLDLLFQTDRPTRLSKWHGR